MTISIRFWQPRRVSWFRAALVLALGSHLLSAGLSTAEEKRAAVAKPATVAEAAKVLDLLKLPAVAGAVEPVNRAVASLSYEAKSECKTAFEFHQKALLKQKWTELPGSSVTDQYASGMFSREGFLVIPAPNKSRIIETG